MIARVNTFSFEPDYILTKEDLVKYYKQVYDTYKPDIFDCFWLFGRDEDYFIKKDPFFLKPYDAKNKLHDVTSYILHMSIFNQSPSFHMDKDIVSKSLGVSVDTIKRVIKSLVSKKLIEISADDSSFIYIDFDAMFRAYGARIFIAPFGISPLSKRSLRKFIKTFLLSNISTNYRDITYV